MSEKEKREVLRARRRGAVKAFQEQFPSVPDDVADAVAQEINLCKRQDREDAWQAASLAVLSEKDPLAAVRTHKSREYDQLHPVIARLGNKKTRGTLRLYGDVAAGNTQYHESDIHAKRCCDAKCRSKEDWTGGLPDDILEYAFEEADGREQSRDNDFLARMVAHDEERTWDESLRAQDSDTPASNAFAASAIERKRSKKQEPTNPEFGEADVIKMIGLYESRATGRRKRDIEHSALYAAIAIRQREFKSDADREDAKQAWEDHYGESFPRNYRDFRSLLMAEFPPPTSGRDPRIQQRLDIAPPVKPPALHPTPPPASSNRHPPSDILIANAMSMAPSSV